MRQVTATFIDENVKYPIAIDAPDELTIAEAKELVGQIQSAIRYAEEISTYDSKVAETWVLVDKSGIEKKRFVAGKDGWS